MTVAQVAEMVEAQSDEWKERHERALATSGVATIVKRANIALTTIGPKVDVEQPFAVRHCPKCTPPPPTWQCPACDLVFDVRWKYDMHLKTNSQTCQDTAKRKARKFARQA
jgi:hypothetical protein